jgi:hypothetical protein
LTYGWKPTFEVCWYLIFMSEINTILVREVWWDVTILYLTVPWW